MAVTGAAPELPAQGSAALAGAAPARAGRGRAWLVFVLLLAVYHVNGTHLAGIDCYPAVHSAWALVRHGSLDLTRYPDLLAQAGFTVWEIPNGAQVSVYPPGSILAALPFVAPLALARAEPFALPTMLFIGKVIASIYVAAAGALFFGLCRRVAPAAAWPATILFGLGTSMWSIASQGMWMHGPATFWLTLGLVWQLAPPAPGRETRRMVGLGLVLGMAALTRPSTGLFVAASAIALWIDRGFSSAVRMSLAALVPIAGLLAHNLAHFGRPIIGGYGPIATMLWLTPFHVGVAGLLAAPSRGLLVYSPALVLAPLGLVRRGSAGVAPPSRSVIVGWSLAAVGTVLVYARFAGWWGGWCFGPRYLCETLPILCLLFALHHQRSGAPGRWLAIALVGLSVLVHAIGVFGEPNDWNSRHALATDWVEVFSLRDTQIEANVRTLLGLPQAR